MDLSTVGGWLACRGAGQYSNRYGKIEDMVTGLEVVLADGHVIRTGGHAPRSGHRTRPDPAVRGSEGTLGVITGRTVPGPPGTGGRGAAAFGFGTFADGLDACRRILRRGATPAVLRLYDQTESGRSFDQPDTNVLIVLDEADPGLVEATMAVVDDECRADPLDPGLVERWLGHRNDVSALAPLWRAGIVVDTVEVAARWAALPGLYQAVLEALGGVEGTLAASSHQSHAYTDGACLYFTFAGRPPGDDGVDGGGDARREWTARYYRRAWDEVTRATEAAGGAISHHHGIGLNRARFLPGALGTGFSVLTAVKQALDPAASSTRASWAWPRRSVRCLAVSVLVVDVGTSGCGPRCPARRRRGARPPRAGAAGHPLPRAGGVRSGGHGRRLVEVASASLAQSGPVDAVGVANQRARPSCGAGQRQAGRPGLGWQDLRTVAPASSCRPGASGWPPTPRPPRWRPS